MVSLGPLELLSYLLDLDAHLVMFILELLKILVFVLEFLLVVNEVLLCQFKLLLN